MDCYLDSCEALLCALIKGCTDSDSQDVFSSGGRVLHRHQDLLRKCGLVEASIQLITCIYSELGMPLSIAKEHLPSQFRVSRLAYLLVERACQANRESKLSMIPYYTMLQRHVSGMIGSYYAMLTIFSGTRELIETVDDEKLEMWRGWNRSFKSCKLLAFYHEICVVEGEPVKRNQSRMCRVLVEDMEFMRLQATMAGDDLMLSDPKKPHVLATSVSRVREKYGEDVMRPTNLDHDDPDLKIYQVRPKL